MTDSAPHVCSPESCPEPGAYYVTCVDGDLFWKMSGPYSSHAGALADLDHARDLAVKYDRSGRAWFMSWGTARMANGASEPGNLNKAGLLRVLEQLT